MGKGCGRCAPERSKEEDFSNRSPTPEQQEDHAGQKAAGIQANAGTEATGLPSHPKDSILPREAQQPGHWQKPPRDSESEIRRGGVAKAQDTQERSGEGSARGRSFQGREPSDQSRRCALAQPDETRAEPLAPCLLQQPHGLNEQG